MQSRIDVGSLIPIKHKGDERVGKVRKIGATSRDTRSKYAWAMLTLDVEGECVYAVAREDELLDYA